MTFEVFFDDGKQSIPAGRFEILGDAIACYVNCILNAEAGMNAVEIVEYQDPDRKRLDANTSYGVAAQKINSVGKWTDWYRDAVNEKEESQGSHEVKTLKLGVIDKTKRDTL